MTPTNGTSTSSAIWLAAAAVEGLVMGCGGTSNGSGVVTVDVPEAAVASAEADTSAGEAQHASRAEPAKTVAADRDCCRGRNECKGLGGCKTEGLNDCKGRNECKGKGGCKSGRCDQPIDPTLQTALPIIPLPPVFRVQNGSSTSCAAKGSCRGKVAPGCCKGLNDCKGRGNCKVQGDHDCAGKNDCKGKGGCKPSTC